MSTTINSPKKSESKESRALYLGSHTPNDLFNRYITVEEMKKHPEITPAIRGDRKIKLDVLSLQKVRLINLKGIQNQNKKEFASKLNSFHKIFFNSFKRNNLSKNQIKLLSKDNKDFSKKYKNSSKNNAKNRFKEIKFEYEKRNYYVSPLDGNKNLFDGNILLSNKEALKNYILYGFGSSKSENKSLAFLHKINKQLGDKTSEKELKKIYYNLDFIDSEKDKVKSDKQKEIEKTQNDIVNTKETINSMDQMKYFFDLDNKKYLDFLKNGNSRRSSAKVSTRVNSALNYFENIKYQYKNEIKQKDNDNFLENQENQINIRKNKGRNKSHMADIASLITEINDKNKIENRRYSLFYVKKVDNDSSKSNLENLYNNISTKENLLNYQKDINAYLKNRKYDLSSKVNPRDVCKNFEKTRKKICQTEILKKDIQLRKKINGNVPFALRINDNNIKSKENIDNIEDKIIKIYCNINNPRKKEE